MGSLFDGMQLISWGYHEDQDEDLLMEIRGVPPLINYTNSLRTGKITILNG
jgi:hypothetical protein